MITAPVAGSAEIPGVNVSGVPVQTPSGLLLPDPVEEILLDAEVGEIAQPPDGNER